MKSYSAQMRDIIRTNGGWMEEVSHTLRAESHRGDNEPVIVQEVIGLDSYNQELTGGGGNDTDSEAF